MLSVQIGAAQNDRGFFLVQRLLLKEITEENVRLVIERADAVQHHVEDISLTQQRTGNKPRFLL